MPNATLTEAAKEAYASCPSNVAILDTIQISHPDLPAVISLVNDKQDHSCTLEDSTVVLFTACGFKMALPAAGENGIQDLTLTVDNVDPDQAITDFVNAVKGSQEPVKVTYRPYRSNDLTTPQMSPPLELYLRGMSLSVFEASGKASFADIVNKKFPNDNYTRERFPSLAG